VERYAENGADGYVEEIPYTYGYHPDLDPARMQAALRRVGIEPPAVATACELGYGQGISLAIHAVAGRAAWWGTDLLPAHAANLRELVAGTGARIETAAEPFATFCAREDLPPFDFIGLYGVWSWVSAANRAVIVRFAARALRPGGVLYLSYNALPGWAPMRPLREALVAHAAAQPAGRSLAARIEAAMAHVGTRVLRDVAWVEAHPGIESEWRAIRHKGIAYLAHEFFNRDWAPMAPHDVAAALAAADLRFAACASGEPPTAAARFRREYFLKDAAPGSDETVTVGAGATQDAAPDAVTDDEARRRGCRLLNRRLLADAPLHPGLGWLADPTQGCGVEVGYTTLLLLEAWWRGVREPAAMAREVAATLERHGQRLVEGGEVVLDASRAVSLLEAEARALPDGALPRFAPLWAP
jgi:SAM-dependent methyltransferase